MIHFMLLIECKKDYNIYINTEKSEEIVQLDGDAPKLVALNYGHTHLTFTSDKDADNKFPNLETVIKVVKPARLGKFFLPIKRVFPGTPGTTITFPGFLGHFWEWKTPEIRISRGGYSMLEELKSYVVSVDVFDDEGKIFPSDNVKISVHFPVKSFYINSTSSNGTFHVVQALAPGKAVIRAQLEGVVLSDGSLFKEHTPSLQNSLSVTVCQKTQIFPQKTLLPSDSLRSSSHDIRLMVSEFLRWCFFVLYLPVLLESVNITKNNL
ncbi:nuclear pore membrane glycoprotein 210-like [Trichonephila clavipes]|nr:nuclear pore membrane glycoprotein 210-like [Trichonephila clavipes]